MWAFMLFVCCFRCALGRGGAIIPRPEDSGGDKGGGFLLGLLKFLPLKSPPESSGRGIFNYHPVAVQATPIPN
jgi:hypothetical protein